MSNFNPCLSGDCNPAPANGVNWSLQFSKICSVELSAQRVSIGGFDISPLILATPFTDVPLPGEKLNFGELSLTFIVDEHYESYNQILDWGMKIGFPESYEQFPQNDDERKLLMTDASLTMIASSGTSSIKFQYEDLWPSSLGALEYVSTENSSSILTCTVGFKSRMFKLVRNFSDNN